MRRATSAAAALLLSAFAWGTDLTSQGLSMGRAVLSGHEKPALVLFSPDGKRLLSVGQDRQVRMWDVTVLEAAVPLGSAKGHDDVIYAASYAPDGRRFATGSYDKTVIVWDAASLKPLKRVSLNTSAVFSLAFSPDSARLAVGCDDGSVRLLDSKTGEQIASLAHAGGVRAAAFSSKSGLLATGSDDGSLLVWAPGRSVSQPVARIPGAHRGGVTAAAFSPDEALLATAGNDRVIRLWNPLTGAAVAELSGHLEAPTSLAFLPGGEVLASGGPDRARFWDVERLLQRVMLDGPDDGALSVAISPDGLTLASGNADNTVRLYLLKGADEQRVLSQPPPPKPKSTRRI